MEKYICLDLLLIDGNIYGDSLTECMFKKVLVDIDSIIGIFDAYNKQDEDIDLVYESYIMHKEGRVYACIQTVADVSQFMDKVQRKYIDLGNF